MVNPYANRQRMGSPAQQPKPVSQVTLGTSQALKKVESIQRKQQKAELKKIKKEAKSTKLSKKDKSSAMTMFDTTSSDEDSSDDSSDDDTSDSVLKNVKSKSNKFIKKQPSKKIVSESEKQENEEVKSEVDESIRDEELQYSDMSSQNHIVMPSTSKISSISSSRHKGGNRVTFEKKISTKNKSQSEATEQSTTNDQSSSEQSSSEGGVNINVILDINELDIGGSSNQKTKSNKKETVSIIKKTKKFDKSEKKESNSIIDNNSSDDDSLSSSIRKNVILDLDDLENEITNVTGQKANNKHIDEKKPPKSDSNKKTAESNKKSSLNKSKQKRTRNNSRSQSIVSIISQESDSIATEIMNDNIETESIASETYQTANESTSHRVPTVSRQKSESAYSNYQEDFDTESEISRIQSSKSNTRISSATLIKPRTKYLTTSAKSVEIQVNDVDLLKNSNLFIDTPLFTPFSVASKRVDWNQYLDLNVANNAFNDLMKMNLEFMKNFINIQRQMYENEMRNLQQNLNK